MTHRRLSQAIAEGDGISVLVHVRDADGARRAEESGAEGIVISAADADVRPHTLLPLLAYGPEPEAAAAADAVVLQAATRSRCMRWRSVARSSVSRSLSA